MQNPTALVLDHVLGAADGEEARRQSLIAVPGMLKESVEFVGQNSFD